MPAAAGAAAPATAFCSAPALLPGRLSPRPPWAPTAGARWGRRLLPRPPPRRRRRGRAVPAPVATATAAGGVAGGAGGEEPDGANAALAAFLARRRAAAGNATEGQKPGEPELDGANAALAAFLARRRAAASSAAEAQKPVGVEPDGADAALAAFLAHRRATGGGGGGAGGGSSGGGARGSAGTNGTTAAPSRAVAGGGGGGTNGSAVGAPAAVGQPPAPPAAAPPPSATGGRRPMHERLSAFLAAAHALNASMAATAARRAAERGGGSGGPVRGDIDAEPPPARTPTGVVGSKSLWSESDVAGSRGDVGGNTRYTPNPDDLLLSDADVSDGGSGVADADVDGEADAVADADAGSDKDATLDKEALFAVYPHLGVIDASLEAGVAANPPRPGETPSEWIARTTGPLPGARPLVVFVALRMVRLAMASAAAGFAAAGLAGVVAADAVASVVLLAVAPAILAVKALVGPPASQEERGDGARRIVFTGSGAAVGVGVAWLTALTAVSIAGGGVAGAVAAETTLVVTAAAAARLVGLPLGLFFWRQPLAQLFYESGRPPRPYAIAVQVWVAAVVLIAVVGGGVMRAYALLGTLGPGVAGGGGAVRGAFAAVGSLVVAGAGSMGVPPPVVVAAALADRVAATHFWLLGAAPTALSVLADPGGMLTALVVIAGAYAAYAAYALAFPMDLLRAGNRPPAAYPTPVSAVLTRWGVLLSEREMEDAAAAASVTAPGGVIAGRAMRMKRAPQLLESGSRLLSSDRADGTLLTLIDQDMRHWAAKVGTVGVGRRGSASDAAAEEATVAAAAEAAGGMGDRATWLAGLGHSRRRVLADGLRTWAQPLAADAPGGTDAADSLSELLFDVMTEEEVGEWGGSGEATNWLFNDAAPPPLADKSGREAAGGGRDDAPPASPPPPPPTGG